MAIGIILRKDALAMGRDKYFTGEPCSSGHISERYVKCNKCTGCVSFRHKRHYTANREANIATSRAYRAANADTLSIKSKDKWRELTSNGWIRLSIRAAKKRAKERGVDFDIAVAKIAMPKVCPYFGMPFIIGDHNWRPSFDRIDPAKGYVIGNVQIISMKANRMKNDGSLDDLITMGRVAERQKRELESA